MAELCHLRHLLGHLLGHCDDDIAFLLELIRHLTQALCRHLCVSFVRERGDIVSAVTTNCLFHVAIVKLYMQQLKKEQCSVAHLISVTFLQILAIADPLLTAMECEEAVIPPPSSLPADHEGSGTAMLVGRLDAWIT